MAAGDFVTIFKPNTYFAPKGTALPALSLAVGAPWPTGWLKIPNTANGVQVTAVNPHQDISSDENGVIKTLPSGADTVNLTWQARTPQMELIQYISGFAKFVGGTNEVSTLAFTAGNTAAAATDVTVRVDNGSGTLTTYTISIPAGATADAAANAVRTFAYGAGFNWTITGTGSSAVFTATTAGNRTDATFTGSGSVTAAFTTTQGTQAYEQYYLDPAVNNEFMVGVEGTFEANTLRTTPGKVRIFAYAVQQTDNPQLHFRTTGSDGILQPVATVRALPGDVTASQLTGTGISKVDPKKRFDFFIV